MNTLSFFKGKRVFITGHTGFKGAWLCKMLDGAGAEITGYALDPPTHPNLFELCSFSDRLTSVINDIRDLKRLKEAFSFSRPEIVFHLAAQPLVRVGYLQPQYTYETNVMGTVNLCEAIRECGEAQSFLNVTTDKVYENKERDEGYREDEPLDGYDPYSNSKSCSELVTHCYKRSFLDNSGIAVSTARAGNVIGGGDFSQDRIVPDAIRAAMSSKILEVRNPYAIRPFQHVIEPLVAYLMIASMQYNDERYSGYYNIGPDDADCITTGNLVDRFCDLWGDGMRWESGHDNGPHEATYLKLDNSKLKKVFGWKPHWDIDTALRMTVDWTRAYTAGKDINDVMEAQIIEYLKELVYV